MSEDKVSKLAEQLAEMKQTAEKEFQRAESIEYNKRWFQEEIVKRDMMLKVAEEALDDIQVHGTETREIEGLWEVCSDWSATVAKEALDKIQSMKASI